MTDSFIRSPCIGICTTAAGGEICRGCHRTFEQVINWNKLTDQQKISVLKEISDRKNDE